MLSLPDIYSWVLQNPIEVFGTVSGLIYLRFSIGQNILTWPFGLLTSLSYIYVFFISKLYANMAIQVYYVLISIYGWWKWGGGRGGNRLRVTRTSAISWGILSAVFVTIYCIIVSILLIYTDSDLPYWDAFTTSLSVVATWMLAQKRLEHWLIWIVVNIVSIGLYAYKELYATVVLFLGYTVMAVVGYFQWMKRP